MWMHFHASRTGDRRPRPALAGVVLLLVGLVLLGLGAWNATEAEAILGHLGRARGKIVALEEDRPTSDRPLRATVQYDAEGSAVFLLHQRVQKGSRAGDELEVLYDRRDPAGRATLRTSQALRGHYVALLGFGAVFVVGAALAFGVALRQQGQAPLRG